MAKVLVAILTAGKPEKLKRCLQSVKSNSSPHERVVVVNTQDDEYFSLACQISFDHGFDVVRSESNGTPGKGKNSVLRYFLTTDADYLFQIDGDDYISESCISRLNEEIESNEFDIACLTNGRALSASKKQITLFEIQTLPKVARLGSRWPEEDLIYLAEYEEFVRSRTINGEPFNRYLLLSRAAAKHKFNENIDIAEDLLHFLQAKQHFHIHEISSTAEDFLYMYDFSGDGQVMASITNKTMVKNLKKMMRELKRYGYER